MSRLALISCLLLAALSLCWCIYRDVQIEKQYTNDLRNRVVGSRLQMDGLSPYFYHWKPADGLRYYDHSNNESLKISNITATPFFHQLLYPIANLQQRTISKIWLVVEYFALLVMTMLALHFAKERKQKWAVIFTSLFFLYSYAWTTSIELGQMYILIALLAMLFYFFITQNAKPLNAVFAGICAMSLLLIRPNSVLFLLPFLSLASRYSMQFKIVLFSSSLLFLLFAFSSSDSRLYWRDYQKAIGEQVKLHQDLSPEAQYNAPIPEYQKWEGWEIEQIKKDAQFPFFKHNGENGNVFVFINLGLHVKTPIWVLSGLCVGFMFLMILIFYKKYRRTIQFNAYSIALLGFCLYMASDIFSPVYRAHYNASQWIFPLLLVAGSFSPFFKKIFVLGIMLGLFFNSLIISLFPMQKTIGEYLIYASILGVLFTFKPKAAK